jgi:uncharacterized protein with GYD domain
LQNYKALILFSIALLLLVNCSKNEKRVESSGDQVLDEYKKLNEQKMEKEKLLKEIAELKTQKEKLSEQLNESYAFIGKWQILSIVENNQPSELTDNWINLMGNGTFESNDGESKINRTGKWNYFPAEQKLYIHSDADEKDDSEWFISSQNDTLIFRATKSGSTGTYFIAKRTK